MDHWNGLKRLPCQEIRELQNRKLRYFINRYLYPFSPYYQTLFDKCKINPQRIQTIEDLKSIPFTSKVDFIASPQEPEKFKNFVLQPDQEKIKRYWPKHKLIQLAFLSLWGGRDSLRERMEKEYQPIFLTFTTGTTNTPVPFLYTAYDIQNLYISGARMINLFEMTSTQRAVNMFPYAPHLAFWQVVFGGFAAGVLILGTGGGKVMSTEGNIAALGKMKPAVVLGVPSFVYHVLRTAAEKKSDMSFVKKVVLGAARITDAFKQRLVDLLLSMGAKDPKIFGTYGFTEARCAWAECPSPLGTSSGYHLYPDKEIFEVIDPKTGEVKKEGEDGELVYTSLDARGSVVLRYRTGDFVRGGISYQPCPYCQWSVPRLSSDITRMSDVKNLQLSKIKGTLVNLDNLVSVLTEIDFLSEWQIEIRKKNNDPYELDELVIYACAKEGIDTSQAEELIKNKVALATEITPNEVIFCSLGEIVKRLELETASKEKRIFDSRPK